MSVERLSSGNYRVRVYSNGKRCGSMTLDHKPTKKEIHDITEKLGGYRSLSQDARTLTFEKAGARYIQLKSNILSPSSIREYERKITRLPDDFLSVKICDIDNLMLQKIANDYSGSHTAKYVKDVVSFIKSVVTTFIPGAVFNVTMPQAVRKDPRIPTKDEIRKLFELIEGDECEIAILLAATAGLRRSEICALTMDDLDVETGVLTINKAMVLDSENKPVIKTTKTVDSTRSVIIPRFVVDKIVEKGSIYNGYIGNINAALHRYEKQAGMEPFSLHKLRHFFASYLHDSGFSDKQIQSVGGWKSDVMKKVYQHAMDTDEAKKKIADNMGGLFE